MDPAHLSHEVARQLETGRISRDLLSEVKGIYTGVILAEAQCIEVDGKQAAQVKVVVVEGLKSPLRQ